ncbi:glycosyltransferase family 4 protein [Anianabacter salinae]|uniref:glycosyltransferase family 4 protein n=1 Tax=Anianabacter salinae TaxID=2851023 RepID=UPI00225DD0DD|nr:glycosyltransferase family 4 protein [Anianabacter salinae]MBV0914164.1 glycosyltransferase family 4 protein [Anianabacter salinae]
MTHASSSSGRAKIAMIVHATFMVQSFLIPHLRRLGERYDLTLMVPTGAPEALAPFDLPVRFQPIPIRRDISLGTDLRTLWVIWRLCRRHKFDMVHTITPKAGLLGILGAWLARIPIRVHTFQGEVWCTSTGMKRRLLRALDVLVARLCTDIIVVSASERDFLRTEGVLGPEQGHVLGAGSIGGVDLARFRPDEAARARRRAELGFSEEDVVFMYLGRLKREKGVMVLVEAFAQLAPRYPNLRLLIVGPDEDGLGDTIRSVLSETADRLVLLPFTATPESEMITTDVLVLPSFREGFGVVIIEAAALGLPSIGSRIYGISDAIVEGETGLMYPSGDAGGLKEAMAKLMAHPERRQKMGHAAAVRVEAEFSQSEILAHFLDFYAGHLSGDREH